MSEFFAGFWGGFFCGVFFLSCCIAIGLRWAVSHKDLLRGLIKEIYHVDLLPFICRIEGLLSLVIMESQLNGMANAYVEIALREVRQWKKQVTEAIKRYEPYQ